MCRLFVRGGFVHDGSEELRDVSVVSQMTILETQMQYLSLIPGRTAGGEHTVLDTASSKMVKYGVVRHDEHASVVFVGSSAIKNTLTQKHGQRRWVRKCANDT